MALSTFSELQAAVLNWLARTGDDSPTLAAALPDCIVLAEAKLNRHLRTDAMETATTLSGTNGVFTLPADFGGARLVSSDTYGPLEQAGDEWAGSAYPTDAGNVPAYFAIQGGSLRTYPAYSGNLTLRYFKAVPALSDATPSNWLLAGHPDVYLFLTVSEAYGFAQNIDAAQVYNQRGMTAAEEIKAQDLARRFVNPSIRVKGPTP